METFKLLFEGQRCGNYADLPLKEHLRLLKFPEAACEKISNNPRVALKAKLKYQDAIEQQKKFIKLGLETSLKLELNPKLFKLGLINKEQTPELLLQPSHIIRKAFA